ncbi:MAG: hypothetical protein WEA28_10230 [Xanthobacteraceae bacterium]
MSVIAHTAFTTTSRIDAVFAAVLGFCAEFCAGARHGREIEARYHALSQRSTPDLARLGSARADMARAALTGRPR